MSYQAWSVVFGEQPSASKWNILGQNDASFNDGSGFAAGALGSVPASLADGLVVQIVRNATTAASTGTTLIPLDDTAPQDTEGIAATSVSITPKSATNIILVIAHVYLASSLANNNIIAFLHKTGSTDAFAMGNQRGPATAEAPSGVDIQGYFTAGGTSAITIGLRAGANGAGTTTINGGSGARQFGATQKTSIFAIELKAS